MGVRIPAMISSAKHVLGLHRHHIARNKANHHHVPKGHIAVYVGVEETQTKRYVVPVTVVNHPSFGELLKRAEEEFGFHHPMGALTIPCREDTFLNLTSHLQTTAVP